ncbi:MAG: hypothetical protein ACE5MH_09385 [Terriglobia bacterium]
MRGRQRILVLFLVAWVIFSFVVASYHPPRTVRDRVLVRVGRYATWQFEPRRDTRRLLIVLLPGLVVGGILLWRSRSHT